MITAVQHVNNISQALVHLAGMNEVGKWRDQSPTNHIDGQTDKKKRRQISLGTEEKKGGGGGDEWRTPSPDPTVV